MTILQVGAPLLRQIAKDVESFGSQELKDLDTDYIDLFWLHYWDYTTPVDEVMRGFDDLVME